jgi:hypothetical protein
MSPKAEDLKFGRQKKYSRQSPTFGHIKYEGVWTHDAWVRHKDAVRERLKALRELDHQWHPPRNSRTARLPNP